MPTRPEPHKNHLPRIEERDQPAVMIAGKVVERDNQ